LWPAATTSRTSKRSAANGENYEGKQNAGLVSNGQRMKTRLRKKEEPGFQFYATVMFMREYLLKWISLASVVPVDAYVPSGTDPFFGATFQFKACTEVGSQ